MYWQDPATIQTQCAIGAAQDRDSSQYTAGVLVGDTADPLLQEMMAQPAIAPAMPVEPIASIGERGSTGGGITSGGIMSGGITSGGITRNGITSGGITSA